MCCCFWYAWPLVLLVCMNHEVVMLQPHTVAPTHLGSVNNCYIDTTFFLHRLNPSLTYVSIYLGGCLYSPWATSLSNFII